MPMIMCSAGKHFYNPDLYEECPSCKEDGLVSEQPNQSSPSSGARTHVIGTGTTHQSQNQEHLPKTTATAATHTPKTTVAAEQKVDSDELKAPIAPVAPKQNDDAQGLKTRVVTGSDTTATAQSDMLPVVGWLVIIEGPGRGRDFRLIQGENTIGRGDDMDVCLNLGDDSDDTVSREAHAVVVYDNFANEFFIERGNSRNLPLLNGATIRRDQNLNAGDIVQLGSTKLRFVTLCDADFTW